MAKKKLYKINVEGNRTTKINNVNIGDAYMGDDTKSQVIDIVLPIALEALKKITQLAFDEGVRLTETTFIPAIEKRWTQFYRFLKRSTKSTANKIKRRKFKTVDTKSEIDKITAIDTEKELYTQEEVEQIMLNMKYAVLYISNRIDELAYITVSDKDDSDKKIEMKSIVEELSSDNIQSIIDYMLKRKNRRFLNKDLVKKLKAFKRNELIVDGELVPMIVPIYTKEDDLNRFLQ